MSIAGATLLATFVAAIQTGTLLESSTHLERFVKFLQEKGALNGRRQYAAGVISALCVVGINLLLMGAVYPRLNLSATGASAALFAAIFVPPYVIPHILLMVLRSAGRQ